MDGKGTVTKYICSIYDKIIKYIAMLFHFIYFFSLKNISLSVIRSDDYTFSIHINYLTLKSVCAFLMSLICEKFKLKRYFEIDFELFLSDYISLVIKIKGLDSKNKLI